MISRRKHPSQDARTTNEKDDEKEKSPKIQPKKGFLSLCRHSTVMTETQKDSTTIKTHSTNTKLNNQAKNDYVHDYLGKNAYVHTL
jgi:hypothetical protein